MNKSERQGTGQEGEENAIKLLKLWGRMIRICRIDVVGGPGVYAPKGHFTIMNSVQTSRMIMVEIYEAYTRVDMGGGVLELGSTLRN